MKGSCLYWFSAFASTWLVMFLPPGDRMAAVLKIVHVLFSSSRKI